jgi:dihydrofolate synthase/folylpolyglutamate synthase
LGGRLLILDASHNPEGASVLAVNLQRLEEETGKRPVVITGALGLARARPLMETVSRFAREIHLVVPQQARACSQTELDGAGAGGFCGPGGACDRERTFPGHADLHGRRPG